MNARAKVKKYNKFCKKVVRLVISKLGPSLLPALELVFLAVFSIESLAHESNTELFTYEKTVYELVQKESNSTPVLMSVWSFNTLGNSSENSSTPCSKLDTLEWYFNLGESPNRAKVLMSPEEKNGACTYSFEYASGNATSWTGKIWPFGISIKNIVSSQFTNLKINSEKARALVTQAFPFFTTSGTALISALPPLDFGVLYFIVSGTFCHGTAKERHAYALVHTVKEEVIHTVSAPVSCE